MTECAGIELSSSSSGLPAIGSVFQRASRDALAMLSDLTEIRVDPVTVPVSRVPGHLMALMLLGNSDIRMLFRVFFGDVSIQHLVALCLARPSDQVTHVLVRDFMKEYCNLVAGIAKDVFSKCGISLGTGLPLLLRGFDEITLAQGNCPVSHTDHWHIEVANVTLNASVISEVIEPSILAVFVWDPDSTSR